MPEPEPEPESGPQILFLDGWMLLPSGFALPQSEFPMVAPARHLKWVDNHAVTPWGWRLHGEALEVVEVAFPDGRPDFGCLCHRPEDAPTDPSIIQPQTI